METITKATKLSSIHLTAQRAGAKFTQVADWLLPDRFRTISEEVVAAQESVVVADISANGKILVEADNATVLLNSALKVAKLGINQGTVFEGGHAYRLRKDLFYIGTSPTEKTTVLKALNSGASNVPGQVTVTDITDGRTELVLIGPDAAELLSLLCGLDLYESKFPDHTAKQTGVAKTNQIVIRRDIGDLRCYHLIGARSYGAYMWETILDAGSSLEITPIGVAAFQELTIS
ncbi:MAG: sarcosine oxidase subunit gamma family protein [Anaerolineae bacterium]|nr:sarcosine oxidase subunit gamma family protein [Anaerolineae bacterium]MDK1081309.1 sarcosine oxidase subunit gamma family protein [Anaerolineae bacterium]